MPPFVSQLLLIQQTILQNGGNPHGAHAEDCSPKEMDAPCETHRASNEMYSQSWGFREDVSHIGSYIDQRFGGQGKRFIPFSELWPG